ncbi:MAG: hypothetical protein KDD22_06775, partial [Bdellovibrionales bacterium]|nr:hypothetical protein [Bdellovibrionales bacterium]
MELAEIIIMKSIWIVLVLALALMGCSRSPGGRSGSSTVPKIGFNGRSGTEVSGPSPQYQGGPPSVDSGSWRPSPTQNSNFPTFPALGNGSSSAATEENQPIMGTGDGSGGDPKKSSMQNVESILSNPAQPQLDFKRRLRLAFHRLEFLLKKSDAPPTRHGPFEEILYADLESWGHKSSSLRLPEYPDDPKTRNLLKSIVEAKNGLTIDQAIQSIEINVQDEACIADEENESLEAARAMAIRGNRLCISRARLATVSPQDLLLQTMALGCHEIAHFRGIKSEESAKTVQDFMAYYGDFLFGNADFSAFEALEKTLAKVIGESSINHKELSKLDNNFNSAREFHYYRCGFLMQALSDEASVDLSSLRHLVRGRLENLILKGCANMDPAELGRPPVGEVGSDHQFTQALLQEVREILRVTKELHFRFQKIFSPF